MAFVKSILNKNNKKNGISR